MKTLKNLSLTLLLVVYSLFSYAQDEPSITTLVSSKNIKDAGELVVDFDGEIITDTWNKDALVRIVMEIKSDDMTKEVVKYLVSEGRFFIKTKHLDDGSVALFMPNIKKEIYINGSRLSEDITFQLFVPENVLVRVRSWDEYRSDKATQSPSVQLVKQL
jgi:hypothetical protein